MSLSPVPSEQPGAVCASCGAALVADQRYCLNCGQPASPVRLAFLDVLAPDSPPAPMPPAGWAVPATIEATPVGYVPGREGGASGWVRRNAGWMGLFTVLLLCLLSGLLVGHWVSQSGRTPTTQTVKIEGLAGLAGLAGSAGAGGSGTATTSPSTPSSSTPAVGASTPKQEKAEAEEAKTIEKQPLAQPKKATTTIEKLSKSTGKKHHEEIEAQGATPIETG